TGSGGGAAGTGGGGSVTSSQAPARTRSDFGRAAPSSCTSPASTRAAAAARDNPNRRDTARSSRVPSNPSGTGSARWVPVVGLLVATTTSQASCSRGSAGADTTRVPSRCRPVNSSHTTSTTPSTRQESATLKIGQTLPSGTNTLIMSTTSPRNGPGGRNNRSTRLPAAPPAIKPKPTAHSPDRNRMDSHPIHPRTAKAIRGNTQVWLLPRLKAAPLLVAWTRYTSPPSNRTGSAPARWVTVSCLVT